jgi:uncharacterized membrane protein
VAAVVYYVSMTARRGGRKDRNAVDIPWVEKQPPEDDALRILRERYAKGEIDFDTYEKMKNDLKRD